jgi:hypothetical protein
MLGHFRRRVDDPTAGGDRRIEGFGNLADRTGAYPAAEPRQQGAAALRV